MDSIESTVEAHCATIMKTDSESWEIRNRAMIQLTELVCLYKDQSHQELNDLFSANVFRVLKEPVKNMVSIYLL